MKTLVLLVCAVFALGIAFYLGSGQISSPISIVKSQPSCVGTWVTHLGGIFGDISIRFDSDGTGVFRNGIKFTWQKKDNGFIAQIRTMESGYWENSAFSGQVSSDGKKMLMVGWGIYGFKPTENTTFEKL